MLIVVTPPKERWLLGPVPLSTMHSRRYARAAAFDFDIENYLGAWIFLHKCSDAAHTVIWRCAKSVSPPLRRDVSYILTSANFRIKPLILLLGLLRRYRLWRWAESAWHVGHASDMSLLIRQMGRRHREFSREELISGSNWFHCRNKMLMSYLLTLRDATPRQQWPCSACDITRRHTSL